LYLIRHGEAKPLGESGVSEDEERPLTEAGQEQSRKVAAGLQKAGVRLSVLLTSPLLRARQTAEAVAGQWNAPAPEVQTCEELSPGKKPKKLSRYLRGLGADSVALVGHMPDLGDYAAWLIGSKSAQIDLAKGGVAFVVCDSVRKGAGTLEWLLTPEWLG
jgi:phosphohistidine phosphatase